MNKQEKKISNAVIRRLPRYLRVLEEFEKKGINRISSSDLSDNIGYTASQIRQDLNHFGGFGQQGYGYNIKELKSAVEKILGVDKQYNVIIVGCGRLGHAVSNYIESYEEKFTIKAIFDVKEELVGTEVAGIKIRHQHEMEAFLEKEKIDIGVITATKEKVQSIAGLLVDGGVKGIWNFVPADIAVPDTVVLENICIADSLHVLTYNLNHN